MKSAPYYQVAAIRRHIARSIARSRRYPAPSRTVAPGQVKQYVLERMFGVLYRNGGFV